MAVFQLVSFCGLYITAARCEQARNCKVEVLILQSFGESVTDAQASLENTRGETTTDFEEPIPCGDYRLRVVHNHQNVVDRAVQVSGDKTTILAGIGGYYGDLTAAPSLSVLVSGVPKGLKPIVRIFQAFGDQTKTAVLNGDGKALFGELSPGLYLVTVLAGERVLCQGGALVGHPLHASKPVRLKVNPDSVRGRTLDKRASR